MLFTLPKVSSCTIVERDIASLASTTSPTESGTPNVVSQAASVTTSTGSAASTAQAASRHASCVERT